MKSFASMEMLIALYLFIDNDYDAGSILLDGGQSLTATTLVLEVGHRHTTYWLTWRALCSGQLDTAS